MTISLKANSDGKSGSIQINGIDKLFIESDGKVKNESGIPLNASLKNHIIDGDFNFWYEGTSQITTGYGSDTMWKNSSMVSTKVASQQSFALGQIEVPGNPKYYSRHVVTPVIGDLSYVAKQQTMEDVTKLAGKTITLSFYAKADSVKNITIEMYQLFGTGGTPSNPVSSIGSQLVALSTAWTKYSLTINMPSASGKTVGTDGNDYTLLNFWFDGGTSWVERSASLGQQSGTFDIARVRLVEGSVDGDDINEDYAETLEKISRFYQTSYSSNNHGFLSCIRDNATTTRAFIRGPSFPVIMRKPPPLSFFSQDGTANTIGLYNNSAIKGIISITSGWSEKSLPTYFQCSAALTYDNYLFHYKADARL